MSDLIARLLDVCQCNLDSSPCGNEDTCLLLREAAEAFAAKDAEIERQRKQIIRMGNQFDKKNRQIIAAVTEAAALRARLAAADGALREALKATERHPLSVGFAHAPATRQELADRLSEIRAILEAAHDATKETGGE